VYVEELHRRGTTVILTTHYLEEAEALCDQIAIIHNGNITANESKVSLLSRLDKRKLVISPTERIFALPESLADAEATLEENGDVVISYRAGKDSISGLLSQFKKAGLSIGDLRTEEPDLEDVFMALTYNTDKK